MGLIKYKHEKRDHMTDKLNADLMRSSSHSRLRFRAPRTLRRGLNLLKLVQ